METKIEYKFDPSSGILYKYHKGSITIKDIITSWESALNNGIIPNKAIKGFILDYLQANFNISIEDYMQIADCYTKHIDIFRNYKIAIITETPADIVIPILVKQLDKGYTSKPFCTVAEAIKWVLS